MSAERIKEAVDQILDQRRDLLAQQLEEVRRALNAQIDQVASFEDFYLYDLPEDILAPPALPPPLTQNVDIIHHYGQQIASALTQQALIALTLEAIQNFCTRAAFFLVRDDKLTGWKGAGFSSIPGSIGDDDLKTVFFSLSAQTIFRQVLNTQTPYQGPLPAQQDDHLILSRLNGPAPREALILPFLVKGKPLAAIYCDRLDPQEMGRKEIEILTLLGAMSLDLLPIRQKILTRVKTQEFVEADVTPQPPGRPQPAPPPPPVRPAAPAPKPTQDPNEVTHVELPDTPLPGIRKPDPERKARVIINDIILYNVARVEEGIRNGNLYELMGDTIRQARDEYLRHFNDLSIFEKQLVQLLAKGHKEVLQGFPFSTL